MIIKSQDLRIGNYLTLTQKHRKELWYEQISAYEDFFEVVTISGDDEVSLFLDDEVVDFETKHIKPIPLVEEWFLKLGFEKKKVIGAKNRFYYIKDRLYYCEHDHYPWVNSNNALEGVSVKYVHQLQNLFYVLKGKELTVN